MKLKKIIIFFPNFSKGGIEKTSLLIIQIVSFWIIEDGVGYGGNIKFEMKLDKRFAKVLTLANEKVYGK